MAAQTSGYSGTPLARKLGLKPGFTVLLYNQPDHYWDLFSDIPADLAIKDEPENQQFDFIHVFYTSLHALHEEAVKYKHALKKNGMLWVSWPKGSSKIQTDLKREPIREHLLSIGLVDIKVAAVDEDWSGLKFVYRVADRG